MPARRARCDGRIHAGGALASDGPACHQPSEKENEEREDSHRWVCGWFRPLRSSLLRRPRRTRESARPSRFRTRFSSTASPFRPRRTRRLRPRRSCSTCRRGSRSTRSCRAPAGSVCFQQTGSGDSAVIQKVTWTGGHTPSGEDSLFQFLGQPAKNGTYSVHRRADLLGWVDRRLVRPGDRRRSRPDDPGEELARRWRNAAADDRRPRHRRARCADRRRSPWSPGVAAVAARGSSHDAWGASRPRVCGCRSGAAGAGRGLRARVSDQDGAVGERHRGRLAPRRRSDLRRSGRAALRDHLGHRQGRPSGDDRRSTPFGRRPRHADRPAAAASPGGLVPRLLAGDLGRRSSRPGRIHVCRRAKPRPGAAVRDPAHLADGDDAGTADRALARCS